MKIKYVGTEPLEHRTGAWAPGEVRDLEPELAAALVRERGDMKQDDVPAKPAKAVKHE